MKALILLMLAFLWVIGCCCPDNRDTTNNRTGTPPPQRERISGESTVRIICDRPVLREVIYDGQAYIVSHNGICKK